MREATSLISLCIDALKKELIHGDDDVVPAFIYELPRELFDTLVSRLAPLGLQKLQAYMPEDWNHHDFIDDCFGNKRKRGRYCKFNTAWRALYKLRWPDLVDPDDWQQMYWEAHLQNCLDEAAEIALIPSFNGCIGDIQSSDTILECIGCNELPDHLTSEYLKLSHHCQRFWCYIRCLRLQNIFCTAEICHLLGDGKLKSLELRLIRSKEHVGSIIFHSILKFMNNICSSIIEAECDTN